MSKQFIAIGFVILFKDNSYTTVIAIQAKLNNNVYLQMGFPERFSQNNQQNKNPMGKL